MSSGFTITEDQIRQKVRELAQRIERDYSDRRPVLVGVLRGSFIFLADLCREMKMDVELDFVAISSYRDADRPGEIVIEKDFSTPVEGRHVILVEDIVDTGGTLALLLNHLRNRHPASVAVCAFLDKKDRREVDVPLDYVGFVVPDEFLIGYGLDYAGRGRNLGRIKTVDTTGGEN